MMLQIETCDDDRFTRAGIMAKMGREKYITRGRAARIWHVAISLSEHRPRQSVEDVQDR